MGEFRDMQSGVSFLVLSESKCSLDVASAPTQVKLNLSMSKHNRQNEGRIRLDHEPRNALQDPLPHSTTPLFTEIPKDISVGMVGTSSWRRNRANFAIRKHVVRILEHGLAQIDSKLTICLFIHCNESGVDIDGNTIIAVGNGAGVSTKPTLCFV